MKKMIWVALVDYSNDAMTMEIYNSALFHRAMLTDQTIEEMEQQVFVVFILFFIYRLNHISQKEKNQSKPLFKKIKIC